MSQQSPESASAKRKTSSNHQSRASDAELDKRGTKAHTSPLQGSNVGGKTTQSKNALCLPLFFTWLGACVLFTFVAYYAYEFLISESCSWCIVFPSLCNSVGDQHPLSNHELRIVASVVGNFYTSPLDSPLRRELDEYAHSSGSETVEQPCTVCFYCCGSEAIITSGAF